MVLNAWWASLWFGTYQMTNKQHTNNTDIDIYIDSVLVLLAQVRTHFLTSTSQTCSISLNNFIEFPMTQVTQNSTSKVYKLQHLLHKISLIVGFSNNGTNSPNVSVLIF